MEFIAVKPWPVIVAALAGGAFLLVGVRLGGLGLLGLYGVAALGYGVYRRRHKAS